jgi:hypothetical protein
MALAGEIVVSKLVILAGEGRGQMQPLLPFGKIVESCYRSGLPTGCRLL